MMRAVRRGLAWRGEVGPALISYLSQRTSSAALSSESDPIGWALEQLGFDRSADAPASSTIQRGLPRGAQGCPSRPGRLRSRSGPTG